MLLSLCGIPFTVTLKLLGSCIILSTLCLVLSQHKSSYITVEGSLTGLMERKTGPESALTSLSSPVPRNRTEYTAEVLYILLHHQNLK